MPRFRHLRTRLAVRYALLFTLTMALVALAAQTLIGAHARATVRAELATSGAVFDRIWALRARSLANAADVLARDFGFRSAVATGDRPTIVSALDSLRMRAGTPNAFVVTLDGKIVANGGMSRFSGRRQHAANLGMGVHDDYVGRGIGGFLLAELVDAADNWHDVRRLELTVYTDNEPAIRLYRKFGFEEEGLLRNFAYRAGRYVDAYTMARLRP